MIGYEFDDKLMCIVSSELPAGWFAAGTDAVSYPRSIYLSVLGGQDGGDFRQELVPCSLGFSSEVTGEVSGQGHLDGVRQQLQKERNHLLI